MESKYRGVGTIPRSLFDLSMKVLNTTFDSNKRQKEKEELSGYTIDLLVPATRVTALDFLIFPKIGCSQKCGTFDC
jgi:hypothetical protein